MYKLIIKSNNQDYPISWKIPNRKGLETNVGLHVIDYFVSDYENTKALISTFNLKGIIPVASGFPIIKENANEKEYDVEVIFDSKLIHDAASRVNKGSIDVVDFPEYTEFCTDFKEKLVDNEFFKKYITKKNFSQLVIDKFYKLANYKSVDGTYEEEKERRYLNEDINRQLKRYRVFRSAFLIMDQYKKDIRDKKQAENTAEKNKSSSEKSSVSREAKLTLGSIRYNDLAELANIYNLRYEEDLTPEEYQSAFGFELIDNEATQVLKK